MKDLMNEFRAFILRGNVIDLAIAIVIGVAFGAVISALVKDLITPLIAAIGAQPNFADLYFTINNSKFLIGDFINVVLSFIILAAIIFFLVIKPINIMMSRRKPTDVTPTTRECPYCLSVIPLNATRCAFCTAEVPAVAASNATAS